MNDNQTTNVTPLPLAAPGNGADAHLFRDAYEAHSPEFAALSQEDLLPINIDVPAAILTAHGVSRELKPFRAELEALPNVDMQKIDQLPSYARALSHAHTRYLNANEPLEDVKPVYDEALALRETLHLDVNALIHRGFLDSKATEGLSGSVGFKNVATDLQVLGDRLDADWVTVSANSGVKRPEIDRAMYLADRLHVAVGEREQADRNEHEATEARARAFAVFLRVYDGIRRYVHFLRWEKGDADTIAPSLYAGRTRKKAPQTDLAQAMAPNASPGSVAQAVSVPAIPAAANGVSASQPYLT